MTAPTLYEKNGDLKVTRETYPPMEKVIILIDTIESLSETNQKRTTIGDQLPEQEEVQGLMETWPMEKSKVLTRAREKVKRCGEKV